MLATITHYFNYLGNIFIDPKHEGAGIGTEVWKAIEEKYPDTIQWKMDTPHYLRRNHSFYVNKCGGKIIHIESPCDPMELSYLMEKDMN